MGRFIRSTWLLLLSGLFWVGALQPAQGDVLTFQEGVSGYSGTQDTELREDDAQEDRSGKDSVSVDLENSGSNSERQALIRFDGIFGSAAGLIPPGSTINSASLQVTVIDPGGGTIKLHRMLANWQDTSTWDSLTGGIQVDDVEAASSPSAVLDATSTGVMSFTGLATDLQAWSDGEANYGWGMLSDSTDGWDFSTSEEGVVSDRPILTVDFTPPSNDVSGTVFTDEGINTAASGLSVRVLVNGVDQGAAATDSAGAYSVPVSMSAGDWVLAYVDGGSLQATTVTQVSATDISGLDLYADRLIVRNDNGGDVDGAGLASALGGFSDGDIRYSVSGNDVATVGASTGFFIPAGHTFTGNGALTTVGLHINGSYDALSSTITLSGDWVNNGSFSAGSSNVVLSGSGQSITGSTVFNHLSKSVSTADTLTVAAGSTHTVNGNATLKGVSGGLLALRSSSPGSQWALVLGTASTPDIQYVDVQDSDASGSDAGKIPVNPYGSLDSGNLLSWFGSATLTASKTSTVISDPFNSSNPKRIPGAVIEYTLRSDNAGSTRPDTDSVTITDTVDAAHLSVDVNTGVTFTANGSGLSSGSVSYSNDGGSSFGYTPLPDADGYDGNITHIRVTTQGDFNNSSYFTLSYRVKIK